MRYIKATPPRAAQGLTADVYNQVERQFTGPALRAPGLDSPFHALSPDPEVLAGTWIAVYESVLVEHRVSRRDKEAIVTAVSEINECQFCVEVHTVLGRAAGGDAEPSLVEWAKATRSPGSPILRKPPFSAEECAEIVATAVTFHFINRVVDVLHGPGGVAPLLGPLNNPIGRLVSLYSRGPTRQRREPGRSLRLLPDAAPSDDFGWARPIESIAAAWGRLEAAVDRSVAHVVSDRAAASVGGAMRAWDGAEPPLGKAWIEAPLADLAPADQAVARLALLSALAPHRVEDSVVDEFRVYHPTDRKLVAAVAFGAFAAARQIGTWLAPVAATAARQHLRSETAGSTSH